MLKFIKNWLDRLAEENEKSFGKGKLDCCDLNKQKKANTNKPIDKKDSNR